jgi:hypothetical protein
MAAPEMLHARKAALLLHGLPADARDRVLARLSADETARLQPLLEELADLGVPPSLSRELQEITIDRATSQVPNNMSARQRAESLNGADVARALQDCAPVTMAALLRISEWPWRQAALDSSSELRRAEVQTHMRRDAPTLSSAVAEALCERLCQEVAALELRVIPEQLRRQRWKR